MDHWDAARAALGAELGAPADPDIVWSGPDGLLPSPLPVQDMAMGSVAVAADAARELARARGAAIGPVRVDARHVAAAFRGDQLIRLDGEPFPSFAPLSGYWPTADGWLRTHANYPHHRVRLLSALGLPDSPGLSADAERDRLRAALAELKARDVEDTVYDAGGIAVAVRTAEQWAEHPQGRAAAAAPLMERARPTGSPGAAPAGSGTAPAGSGTGSTGSGTGSTGSGSADSGANGPGTAGCGTGSTGTGAGGPELPGPAPAGLPAHGVRVLDLTRVIAGPVATRTLALLGADVLRVDPRDMPELDAQHLDVDLGKRSTALDLRDPADRAVFEGLLERAHVVVTSYRPGALTAFGLDPDTLAERRPDLVVATLSAWGTDGPFAHRRGFDSIVQAVSGIALLCARDDGTPGALPVQALDHVTGYLTAAGVLLALADRVRHGTGSTLHPALARTAHTLLTWHDAARPGATTPIDDPVAELDPVLTEADCAQGRLRHPLPAFRLDDGPATWSLTPNRWGTDAPTWSGP